MKIEYNLIKTEKNTKARLGTIKTNYGTVETPMFMPVGTKATVKGLSPEEVKETGAGIVLANTYHLWLRPGEDIVEKAGGLHRFMNYDASMNYGSSPVSTRSKRIGATLLGGMLGMTCYYLPISKDTFVNSAFSVTRKNAENDINNNMNETLAKDPTAYQKERRG